MEKLDKWNTPLLRAMGLALYNRKGQQLWVAHKAKKIWDNFLYPLCACVRGIFNSLAQIWNKYSLWSNTYSQNALICGPSNYFM